MPKVFRLIFVLVHILLLGLISVSIFSSTDAAQNKFDAALLLFISLNLKCFFSEEHDPN
jgi:hypothetical protein